MCVVDHVPFFFSLSQLKNQPCWRRRRYLGNISIWYHRGGDLGRDSRKLAVSFSISAKLRHPARVFLINWYLKRSFLITPINGIRGVSPERWWPVLYSCCGHALHSLLLSIFLRSWKWKKCYWKEEKKQVEKWRHPRDFAVPQLWICFWSGGGGKKAKRFNRFFSPLLRERWDSTNHQNGISTIFFSPSSSSRYHFLWGFPILPEGAFFVSPSLSLRLLLLFYPARGEREREERPSFSLFWTRRAASSGPNRSCGPLALTKTIFYS